LLCRIAAAISSRSRRVSLIAAAPIQPSTCFGVRAPTMAPLQRVRWRLCVHCGACHAWTEIE
jgi:hypothetical protein